MQRKLWTGIAGALCLLVGMSVAASAESIIVLSGGAGQTVMFSGQGSGTQTIGIELGQCQMNGDCVLSGTGSGSGTLASSGTFTINSQANSIVLSPNGSGGFNASASAPIDFTYNGSASGQTGTLLHGTLGLNDFDQAQGSASGSFNSALNTNLLLSGGLLASLFNSSQGALGLNVTFPANFNVSTLVGTNLSVAGSLPGTGAGSVTPTPEPGTLLLMGAGMLALGLCLRRGIRHAQPV